MPERIHSTLPQPRSRSPLRFNISVLLSLLPLLASCDLPRDPENSWLEARGNVVRVGVTEHPPWVVLDEGRPPAGIEPELARAFARTLDARIEWIEGSEAELFRRLEQFDLHLVLGGIESDTPWSGRVALSRPYLERKAGDRTIRHVIATPPGENRFLLDLDRFIESEGKQLAREFPIPRSAHEPAGDAAT